MATSATTTTTIAKSNADRVVRLPLAADARLRRPMLWRVWLPAVFAIVVLSFIGATVLSQVRLMAIDEDASEIADNAVPSIEALSNARRDLRQLQLTASEELAHARNGEVVSVASITKARRLLDDDINRYLLDRTFPDEQALWADILRTQSNIDDAVVELIQEITRGELDSAEETIHEDLQTSSLDLSTAIGRAIDFNAVHAHDLAEKIRKLRGASMYLALVLDSICMALAMGAVVVLGRAIRSRTLLVERHRQLLEARASELEEFAGRVAHDIRSPIGTVSFALELAATAKSEEQREVVLSRGRRATQRVVRLVDGLLSFAKAAATPDPTARASVSDAIDDVVADLTRTAADARVEVSVDVDPSAKLYVGCEPGVLTSMISNLASNAIKYIGDADVRLVTIHAFEQNAKTVRVEVADTGPGLPAGFEDLVFEPYVRGQRTGRGSPGIGLGLATVRRMAQAHGGRVGVISKIGEGCTFWFELPIPKEQKQEAEQDANEDQDDQRERRHQQDRRQGEDHEDPQHQQRDHSKERAHETAVH